MSNLLQSDERIYRACIYYEAICKTPVEKAYKRMKKVKPNLDYLDFEYWYYRFLNGDHDLDHDRSTDPKTRGFSDMPIEVVENIVGNLGSVDKLSTGRVCRKLRAVINNKPLKFGTVSMRITDYSCNIQFERWRIEFSSQEDGNYRMKAPRKKSISLKGDYSRAGLEELVSIITHPNLSFEELELDFPCERFFRRTRQDPSTQINLFNSMLSNHQIHVEQLKIKATSLVPVVDLLSKFDADIIESIDFDISESDEESAKKLVKMDQWKNAKELKLSELPRWISIENLFHCREFEIENEIEFCPFAFENIGKILFKSPIFESCSLLIENDDEQEFTEESFFELVDDDFGARTDFNRRHYPIENSKDYFECTYKEKRYGSEQYPSFQLGIRRVRI